MQVDVNDPDSVLWLQQSLSRVIPWRILVEPTGQYNGQTRKAVEVFQLQSNLPQTGEPDIVTTTKIEEDLAVLDAQPFKKKQNPLPPPPGNPGDPLP